MNTKFAFFGTPYVARDTLAYLVTHGHAPEVVITSPDAPRGRGLALTPCQTKVWAKEHNLDVLSPEKLNDEVLGGILKYDCAYALVVAYGKILPRSFLEMFPQGAINVHYSLLPAYRGASPVENALLHGETTTGVTLQKMVYEMDAGDIIAQETVGILPTETTRELRPRLVRIGAEFLVKTIPRYLSGEVVPITQDPAKVTFARKIDKKEGALVLGECDEENWRKYRAFAEGIGTYFFSKRNGQLVRVKIKTARFENGKFIPERIVPEGNKEIAYADFVRV